MNLFGIQHQSGAPADVHRIDYGRLATVKLLGNALNIGFARDIRARAPHALIVLRAAGGDQDYTKAASVYADYACRLLDPFLSAGLCDVAEPLNEPVIRNDTEAMQLNAWQVDYARIMHARGYSVGAYNFSVGNPELVLWPFLYGGLRGADWLMLHEYGAPRIESDAAFTSLRHRAVYASLPPDCRKALLITECGIDLWTNGYAPGGGGYQRVTNCADYVGQIKGWLAELEKDGYVRGVHLYGYGMEAPWSDMGFDVASNENDRETFLSFVSGLEPVTRKPDNSMGGVVVPPEPPTGGSMARTAQDRLNAAWRAVGIAYNPDAAFPKEARKLGLGRPVTNEYRDLTTRPAIAGQGFDAAFLECAEGDWSHMTAYDWLTGEPYSAPVPPTSQPGTLPPYVFPPILTAAGFIGIEGHPAAGHTFYRIAPQATVRLGVSAFCDVTVLGPGGVPAIGVQVVSLRADGKGEILSTDGSGKVRFYFGAGSAFTPPARPPFEVFIAEGATKDDDSKLISVALQVSDSVCVGDTRGEHTETYLQFVGYAM